MWIVEGEKMECVDSGGEKMECVDSGGGEDGVCG